MLTDEQLVERAQAGDERAFETLLRRYESVARWTARQFYDHAAEPDDLRQEARVGVFKAVRDYAPDAGTSFATFAFLCCKRSVMDAVSAATRMKHGVLSSASRVALDDDGDEIGAIDAAADPGGDPAEILAVRAQLRAVVTTIRQDLSPLEREWVVAHVFCGRPYSGSETTKRADNALQRARRKLAVALAKADAVPLGVAA